MVLQLLVSAGVLCGGAAAYDQPLQALNASTPHSMQACTQLALQNAVSPARQKKLMRDNVMAGGINYAHVLGNDRPKHGTKLIAKAKIGDHGDCVIPLTQEKASPETRFELRKLPSNFSSDSMGHSGLPVCGASATAK
jgi:hypothetical protein